VWGGCKVRVQGGCGAGVGWVWGEFCRTVWGGVGVGHENPAPRKTWRYRRPSVAVAVAVQKIIQTVILKKMNSFGMDK
jgi:hypothetical protein